MDASPLQFNPADPQAWRDRLVHGSAPEAERLAATTREFEALLLRQYLNEALKPLTSGGPGLGGDNAVYGYLVTDALANGLSSSGVFGFSNILQAQVAGATGTDNDHTNHTL
jgi:flagellar protein FlgJ